MAEISRYYTACVLVSGPWTLAILVGKAGITPPWELPAAVCGCILPALADWS